MVTQRLKAATVLALFAVWAISDCLSTKDLEWAQLDIWCVQSICQWGLSLSFLDKTFVSLNPNFCQVDFTRSVRWSHRRHLERSNAARQRIYLFDQSLFVKFRVLFNLQNFRLSFVGLEFELRSFLSESLNRRVCICQLLFKLLDSGCFTLRFFF